MKKTIIYFTIWGCLSAIITVMVEGILVEADKYSFIFGIICAIIILICSIYLKEKEE